MAVASPSLPPHKSTAYTTVVKKRYALFSIGSVLSFGESIRSIGAAEIPSTSRPVIVIARAFFFHFPNDCSVLRNKSGGKG
jgi:hypothetical protein